MFYLKNNRQSQPNLRNQPSRINLTRSHNYDNDGQGLLQQYSYIKSSINKSDHFNTDSVDHFFIICNSLKVFRQVIKIEIHYGIILNTEGIGCIGIFDEILYAPSLAFNLNLLMIFLDVFLKLFMKFLQYL